MSGGDSSNIFRKIKGLVSDFKTAGFFSEDFFQSQITRWLLGLSLAANLINWIILKIFVQPVDFPIILHYNVYFGVDILGDWKQVFTLPFLGIVLLVINVLLALFFYDNKERIASYILLLAMFMIQLNLLVASVSITVINY